MPAGPSRLGPPLPKLSFSLLPPSILRNRYATRDYLLSLDANTLAPCAHNRPCPLLNDWCHFPQRLERPSFQRRAKSASAGWEESKFSYAAMARFSADTAIWGRLIHQPHKQKNAVSLNVSSIDGIVDVQVPKSNREAFRQASKYEWGDIIYPIFP
jgi:ribosomal protein RSM22 (predicted rRNA methylase)